VSFRAKNEGVTAVSLPGGTNDYGVEAREEASRAQVDEDSVDLALDDCGEGAMTGNGCGGGVSCSMLLAVSAPMQTRAHLDGLNKQVVTLFGQGKYAEAALVAERSLTIAEMKFGPDHPDVAQSLNNLAALNDNQGRYAEAEPLYKRALAIREKALGPEPCRQPQRRRHTPSVLIAASFAAIVRAYIIESGQRLWRKRW
jgi:tetratricopeptide (TPR) repeat protein